MQSNGFHCEDQAAGLRQLTSNHPLKIIAVTAGKGGVGKTNVSVNLSIALAKRGHRVLLLDGDLGLANIDVMLGLYSEYNLSHVIEGQCSINDILVEGPLGIKLIPSSSGTERMASLGVKEHAGIVSAFSEITHNIDYFIVDTAAGISESVLSFTRSSQEIIVVVNDEPTSLTDAYALIKVMHKRYGTKRFHVLANMVRAMKDGKLLFNQLARVSGQFLDVHLDYLGAIPFDEMVHKAVKLQQAVLTRYPSSAAALGFKSIAATLEKWPQVAGIDGNTGFFIERLVGVSECS